MKEVGNQATKRSKTWREPREVVSEGGTEKEAHMIGIKHKKDSDRREGSVRRPVFPRQVGLKKGEKKTRKSAGESYSKDCPGQVKNEGSVLGCPTPIISQGKIVTGRG